MKKCHSLLNIIRTDAECGEIIKRRWWHRNDGKRAAASAEILREIATMRKSGNNIGERTYTAAIEVLGRRKRSKHSEIVFWAMSASGITPTDTSYDAILRAFSDGHRYDRIAAFWSDMKKRQILPNPKHYDTLLKTFVSLGDPIAVTSLLSEMKSRGIKHPPNTNIIRISSQASVSDAYNLSQELGVNLHGNDDVASSIFHIAERTKNLSAALSLHKVLQSSCGSAGYYCCLLDVFIACDQNKKSLSFFKSIPEEFKTSPTRGLYERFLTIHLLNKSKELHFDLIVDSALNDNPDYSPLYAISISLYKQVGNQRRAFELDQTWQQKGIRPDAYLIKVSETITDNHVVIRPPKLAGGMGPQTDFEQMEATIPVAA